MAGPPPVQKKHTSYAPFHDEIFDYATEKLIKLRNATAVTCPAGRTLIELAGKRLIPDVNPGVNAIMVMVHDSVSGIKGFINPKSAAFKKPIDVEATASMEVTAAVKTTATVEATALEEAMALAEAMSLAAFPKPMPPVIVEHVKKKVVKKETLEKPVVSVAELSKQRKQELAKLVDERTAEIKKTAEDSISAEVEKRFAIHKTTWEESKLAEFKAELEAARKEAAEQSAKQSAEDTETRITKELTEKWQEILKQSKMEAIDKVKHEHAEQIKIVIADLECKHNESLNAAVENARADVTAKYEALMKRTVESAVNDARKETEECVTKKLNAEFEVTVKSAEIAAIQRATEEEKRKQIEINEQRKKARIEAEQNRIGLSKTNAITYIEMDDLEIPPIETLHKYMSDPKHTVKTVVADKVATIDLSRGTAFSIVAFFDIGIAAANLNCLPEDSIIEIYLTNFSGQAILTASFQDMYENFESAATMRINRLFSMYLAYKVKGDKLVAVGSYGPYGSPRKLMF